MGSDYSKDYSIEELMVVRLSHELRDGEVGFVGMGTGGRAFTLAVGIPLAAIGLAQMTHAPNFIVQMGSFTNPRFDEVPASQFLTSSLALTRWRSEAYIPVWHPFELFKRGKIDVAFASAAQIDKYGNLNITVIGDYHKPKVRLTGALLQPEHLILARRGEFIVIDHERRNFVEKVDFTTSVGYLDGYDSRERAGLIGGGPLKVVTNICVMGFDERTKRMRLESTHPGVSIEDVGRSTGFELLIPEKVPETERPTRKEVELLRNVIDPRGVFLRQGP